MPWWAWILIAYGTLNVAYLLGMWRGARMGVKAGERAMRELTEYAIEQTREITKLERDRWK